MVLLQMHGRRIWGSHPKDFSSFIPPRKAVSQSDLVADHAIKAVGCFGVVADSIPEFSDCPCDSCHRYYLHTYIHIYLSMIHANMWHQRRTHCPIQSGSITVPIT